MNFLCEHCGVRRIKRNRSRFCSLACRDQWLRATKRRGLRDGERRCTKCRVAKLLSEFPTDRNAARCHGCLATYARDRYRNKDKLAHRRSLERARYQQDPRIRRRLRNYELTRKYGITAEEYNRLFQGQDGRCAICKQPERPRRNGTIPALAVDHSHVTNSLRGLLCSNCNGGLGQFGDDPRLLRAALRYLAKYAIKHSLPHQLLLIQGGKILHEEK